MELVSKYFGKMEETKRQSTRTYKRMMENQGNTTETFEENEDNKINLVQRQQKAQSKRRDQNLPKNQNGKVHHQGLELVIPLHHPLLLLQTLAESLKNIFLGHTI